MIKINTDEMDRLTEVFTQLGLDVEDTLGKTTTMRNEMLEDTEFMAHPKSEEIVTIIDSAIDNLTVISEDIKSLKTLFVRAKDDFTDNEKDLVKEINDITNKLDAIKSQLDTTIASNQVVVLDRTEESHPVNEVEQLVTGSSAELEMASVAALTQAATQEMKVKKIEDKE